MDRTQRLQLRSAGGVVRDGTETQPLLAVLVGTALIVALCVYGVMRAAPPLIAAFAPRLASMPANSSSLAWMAPSIAVGVFLFGASIAAFGLTAFVHGVRRDPFRFLAPVLIGFASMVMVPLELERTMGAVPASIFAALSALFLLGGGALLQAPSMLAAAAGSVMLSLPVFGLVLDRAHHIGIDRLLSHDRGSLLSLLVLALTSFGVGLTAYIGRPSGELAQARLRDRSWERHREQLAQALEHVRHSELRAEAAEVRARELEQLISEHCDRIEADDAAQAVSQHALHAEAELLTGSRGKGLRAFFVLCAFVIGASAGAVALHAWKLSPLQAQLGRERDAAGAVLAAREREASDVKSAHTQLEAERARLQAELDAERKRAQEALAEAKTASETLSALQAQAAAVAVAPEPVKAPAARASKTRAPRKKRVASAAGTPTANTARTLTASAEGTTLREAVDDDPIGGL